MKIKQTIIALALAVGLSGFVVSQPVYAEVCGGRELKTGESCCGGVPTSVLECDKTGGGGIEETGLWWLLILVINILSAGVGIAAVGGIVWGSILYTTSGGSIEQTRKSRTVIFNTIVGILLYFAMWAFLNFLIPGGLFK